MYESLSNEAKMVNYVSVELKKLIAAAIERGSNEVELLIGPHLHGTSAQKILDLDSGAWEHFGEHALSFKSEAKRTDAGLVIKIEAGGGEKRCYEVSVTEQGVLLSFKVHW